MKKQKKKLALEKTRVKVLTDDAAGAAQGAGRDTSGQDACIKTGGCITDVCMQGPTVISGRLGC